MRFRFVLDDLRSTDDLELHERAMSALGRLCLWCLRNARTPDELIRGIGGWLDLAREVRRAPNGRAALAALWRYIVVVGGRRPSKRIVAQLLQRVTEDEAKEEIVEATDDYFEDGLIQGRAEGERRLLLRQLKTRFGDLPGHLKSRIDSANTDELELWAERILFAKTPDEIFD